MPRKLKTKKPTCCLVASDLHCLSVFALLRPGFVTQEGNEIGLNPFQKWLWECWESLIAEVDQLRAGREFILIFNGDLIEGNHHRTKEILACDEAEHAAAAIYTIQDLVDRACKIAVVEGTECHTGNFENYIGKQIGAMQCPDTKAHVFGKLMIRLNGVLAEFRHHMPTTQRVYLQASQLSIQFGNAQLAAIRAGHEPPKILGMAHRHVPDSLLTVNGLVFVSPAWQGLTRYGRKVAPDGVVNPGFVWLDWANKEPGEMPDHKLLYRSPQKQKVVDV